MLASLCALSFSLLSLSLCILVLGVLRFDWLRRSVLVRLASFSFFFRISELFLGLVLLHLLVYLIELELGQGARMSIRLRVQESY